MPQTLRHAPMRACHPIDLHRHSLDSDGKLAPVALVAAAKQHGLEVLGLTDHETMAGLPPAIAEGLRTGVEVVPGIEIAVRAGPGRLASMVGLFVDPTQVSRREDAYTTAPTPLEVFASRGDASPSACRHVPRRPLAPAEAICQIRDDFHGVPFLVEGPAASPPVDLEEWVSLGLAGIISPSRPRAVFEQRLADRDLLWVPGSDDHEGAFAVPSASAASGADDLARTAMERLRLRFLSRNPHLVVLTGLPGCGKSHLSRLLEELLLTEPICLDMMRERYFPLKDVGAPIKYSRHVTEVMYTLAQEKARARLAAGKAAILDGTFMMTRGRQEAASLVAGGAGEVIYVKATAPEEVVESRLDGRTRRDKGSDHGSDAGLQIYRMMKEKLDRQEAGYADPEEDARRGRLPGSLLVVDSHAMTVRPVNPTRLTLALTFGLVRRGFTLGGRR